MSFLLSENQLTYQCDNSCHCSPTTSLVSKREDETSKGEYKICNGGRKHGSMNLKYANPEMEIKLK